MLKKAQVIMLPTEKGTSSIAKSINHNILSLYNKNDDKYNQWINQNLYITSDDEIKEGDWFIQTHQAIQTLVQCDKQNVEAIKHFQSNVLKAKKIIATTDTSLKVFIDGNGNKSSHELTKSGYIEFLPQPSQQFIEKYIESYNKGEVITDVLVEYEIDVKTADYAIQQLKLKVNPKDNTITIKKLKDNWNREEVIQLYKTYQSECLDGDGDYSMQYEEWLEENL